MGGRRTGRAPRQRRQRRHERRHRAASEHALEGARRQAHVLPHARRVVPALAERRHARARRRRHAQRQDDERRRRERPVPRRLDVARAEAQPDDGLLDVVVIGDITKADFVRNVGRIYKGTHLTHPKIDLLRGPASRSTPTSRSLELDGEQPGTTPAAFEIVLARCGFGCRASSSSSSGTTTWARSRTRGRRPRRRGLGRARGFASSRSSLATRCSRFSIPRTRLDSVSIWSRMLCITPSALPSTRSAPGADEMNWHLRLRPRTVRGNPSALDPSALPSPSRSFLLTPLTRELAVVAFGSPALLSLQIDSRFGSPCRTLRADAFTPADRAHRRRRARHRGERGTAARHDHRTHDRRSQRRRVARVRRRRTAGGASRSSPRAVRTTEAVAGRSCSSPR